MPEVLREIMIYDWQDIDGPRAEATLAAPPDQASGKNITVEAEEREQRGTSTARSSRRAAATASSRTGVRQYVQSCGISRGKLDVSIGVESVGNGVTSIGLDRALAGAYIDALRALRDEFGLKDDISVMTVAANPRPFRHGEAGGGRREGLGDDEAGARRGGFRVPEGQGGGGRTAPRGYRSQDGADRKSLAGEIKKLSEEDAAAYRSKFEAKLRKLISDSGVEPDTSLVLTECAIYADRAAIDEEIVRLSCHLGAFREILAADEPVGQEA